MQNVYFAHPPQGQSFLLKNNLLPHCETSQPTTNATENKERKEKKNTLIHYKSDTQLKYMYQCNTCADTSKKGAKLFD